MVVDKYVISEVVIFVMGKIFLFFLYFNVIMIDGILNSFLMDMDIIYFIFWIFFVIFLYVYCCIYVGYIYFDV